MSLDSKKVACPLDCYDTCQAYEVDDNIKGSIENLVTNKKLCVNFANLLKQEKLEKSYYQEEVVSLDKSLEILEQKLNDIPNDKTLFYKGSGNLGVMQSAVKNFFAKHGSVLTKGSLCDGAGALGIEQGRGSVQNPPIEDLIDSDVIVVWGRNFTVTSKHMYELVKDKTFITIDPIKTTIAKKSKLHMQLNPKSDYELALYLTRLAFMNRLDDEQYLEDNTQGHDWFFDVAKNRPLVSYEETTGVSLDEAYEFFDIIENKKVSFVLGVGVQKYFEGAQIMRCIDSFATFLGVHKQNQGGVWYSSDSNYGYEKQFEHKAKNKKVSVASVDFSKYDLVFIQGANPVVSAPNTEFVKDGLENSFVVYFGTTYNETCKYANLIIPSSDFLSKKDVRLSYGHEYIAVSQAVRKPNENTISEYKLASFLIDKFDYEKLKDENEVIDYYINNRVEFENFEEFEFIEDVEIEPLHKKKTKDNYYLITAKNEKSINSQFFADDFVYLNSQTKFNQDDEVVISSKYGSANFKVKISDDIKSNCAFFYAGNRFVNYLTPNIDDEESYSAMYQEVLISIELS
ncbi:MAG: molybdopterin-dependent oxidoreductase [Campylobacterota bacterium]